MDLNESGIDNNESKVLLEVDLPKISDPIITFSPDRSRFDAGSQNHKSRNASIASDFDLNLEVTYSTADIKVNPFQNQPPGSITPSLTDLLSSSEKAPTPLNSQFNSTKLSSEGGVNHTINNFNLDLKSELYLGGLAQNQTQARVSNGNIGSATCSGQSMSTLVTASVTPPTKRTNLTSTKNMSLNGSTMEVALNTTTLQKKLEKKIAQASAIEAAMNSMAPTNTNDSSHAPTLSSPKNETEFGDWNTHSKEPDNYSNSSPTSKLQSSNDTYFTSTTTDPQLASKCLGKSKSSSKPKHGTSHKNRYSSAEDRTPACVKFQENEVEIICKSNRNKVPGGLLPPERLAIPNKNLPGNNSNSRKQSRINSVRDENSSVPVDSGGGGGANHPNAGSTSEVKPLVEWDSDESEEELSFFPAGKPKAKLTDNLSIDNLSLSGEEDDLHLSPPTAMIQKCPCDPRLMRQWISDHASKLPKSNSFSGVQGGQCVIS